MNNHGKKMIAPIIISALIVLYLLGLMLLFFAFEQAPLPVRALILIIPLALAGVMIYALYSRIKEIRSGEEDDLGKY